MRILIVEDEFPTAEDIKYILTDILADKIESLKIETSLRTALLYLSEKQIDLLFLDLNLNGKDGFEILKNLVAKSFHTIIVSANSDRAIEAYEYGILDFVAKPYSPERIKKAIDRYYDNNAESNHPLKYLSTRNGKEIKLIKIDDVNYFQGASNYVEVYLKNGKMMICDKNLLNLETLLPKQFERIHKSFIIRKSDIVKIMNYGAGKYEAILKTGTSLPISRTKYQELKDFFLL